MLKVAIIFGGMSTEHDISIISGTSILKNIDKEKYEIFPIYINKSGKWFKYKEDIKNIKVYQIGEQLKKLEQIDNVMEYLSKMDCIFPVLHGLYGEDGTIQGMFEILKIPYVGCKVLSSSISMDKAYTKIIFDRAKLKQARYIYIKKVENDFIYIDNCFNEIKIKIENLVNIITQKIKFPLFIKPSNSGSSIGVNKANTIDELIKAINYASKFDNKILVEEGIIGRELECAVIGNENLETSCVGEVLSAEEFYSFDSKYKNIKSMTDIPANINKEAEDKIRNMAKKAFKAVDGKGLARVDFFIENKTSDIYINEINTMPGFTNISMYPKLFEFGGVKYGNLLDKLIELSLS